MNHPPALEQALHEIDQMPPDEQEALGEWLLAELATERKWAQSFARPQDLLAEHQGGDEETRAKLLFL